MNKSYFIPSDFFGIVPNITKDRSLDKISATIIYSILFEGKMVVLDNMLINVFHLRNAVKNETIRGLFDNKIISIASVKENDSFIDLKKLANNILTNNTISPSFINKKEFKDFTVLEHLDKNADKIPYSISEAKKYYSNSILDSFRESNFEKYLPSKVQTLILNITEDKMSKDGHINSSFFERKEGVYKELQKYFPGKSAWDLYGKFLTDVSIANFHAYIPSTLTANPIYGSELSRAFNIWRDTFTSEIEDIEEPLVLRSYLNPVNFVKGLLTLSYEDILFLLSSDEFLNYQKAITEINNSSASVRELKYSYEMYKRRIDWKILENTEVLSKEEHDQKIKFQKLTNLREAGKIASEHIALSILDTFTFNLTSHIKLGIDLNQVLKRKDQEIDGKVDSMDVTNSLIERLSSDDNETLETINSRAHFRSNICDTMLTISKL